MLYWLKIRKGNIMYLKQCKVCKTVVAKRELPNGRLAYICNNKTCSMCGIAVLFDPPTSIKHLNQSLYSRAVAEAKFLHLTIGEFTSKCYQQYFEHKESKGVDL